ncbi:hypothetical protein QUF74_14885 [Candidatus Halobeggiatoa sp. HSG11]|nr:hypothetical protein [Candidatus Halobeggiatoa sp. HSG11]
MQVLKILNKLTVMAVNLPAPIGKKADKSKQLAVKLHIDSYDEIVIRSSYGKVFKCELRAKIHIAFKTIC